MSSVYTGVPGNVSDSLAAAVSGATNASPIVIQTSAAHLFGNGDTVVVASVGGNTAANGTWIITVVDSTHFSLNGSTGNGAYTSGGTATDVSLTPQLTIPSDGDPATAASINTSIKGLADRTQFLTRALPVINNTYQLADYRTAAGTSLGTSLTWAGSPLTSTVSLLNNGIVTLSGDLIEVTLFSTGFLLLQASGIGNSIGSIQLQANQNGGGLVNITDISCTFEDANYATSSLTLAQPFTATGTFTVSSPGTLNISVKFSMTSGNTNDQFGSTGFPYTASYKVWRRYTI